MIDVTLLLDIMILLEVRLDPLAIKLEFSILPVSFRAFDIRLSILDFSSVVKFFVASFVGVGSMAETSKCEMNIQIANRQKLTIIPSIKAIITTINTILSFIISWQI
jgi:hypothetical protein